MTKVRYYLLQGLLTVAAVLTVSMIHVGMAVAKNCAMVAPNGSPMNAVIPDAELRAAGYAGPQLDGFGNPVPNCPPMLAADMAKFANFNAASLMNPFAVDTSEGLQIGFAIMAVWAAAWGIKMMVRTLRG